MSLDALRGFDMLFIMGGEELVYAVAALLGSPDFAGSFGHVPWDGLQFMDTVFPLFLFMAGVSFPFSCARSRERGLGDKAIALKCLERGLILVLLGLLRELLQFHWCDHLRVWSVLGRIGLAWMFASWLYLFFKTKDRIVIAVSILAVVTVGTVLLLAPDAATVVYPESLKEIADFGRGPFSAAGNFGCWLDRTLTGGHIYRELYDPEGFSGILPAVVTAMLGMFAGEIVRRGYAATGRKSLQLLACGVGCVAAGLLLSLVCPINKALWSPSFTLVVGGYSFALFALFYWLIDVKEFRGWSFFFRVIGMNSITIYMAQQIIGFNQARKFFFGGLISYCPDGWRAVASSATYILVCWAFLFFLYRKKIFLKV